MLIHTQYEHIHVQFRFKYILTVIYFWDVGNVDRRETYVHQCSVARSTEHTITTRNQEVSELFNKTIAHNMNIQFISNTLQKIRAKYIAFGWVYHVLWVLVFGTHVLYQKQQKKIIEDINEEKTETKHIIWHVIWWRWCVRFFCFFFLY